MGINATNASDIAASLRGGTASREIPSPRWPGAPPGGTDRPAGPGPRHRLGDALRVIAVFADTAFRVVVLGTDATRQPDPPPAPHPADRGPGTADRGADRGREG